MQSKSFRRVSIQNDIYDFNIYIPWFLWAFLVTVASEHPRKSISWQSRLKMTNQRKQKEEINYSLYIWKHDWYLGIYFSRWGSWVIMRTSFSSLWEEGWKGHPCEWKSEGGRVMIPVMSSLSVRPTEVLWDACNSLSPSLSHGICVRARSDLSKHLAKPSHLQSGKVNCSFMQLMSGVTFLSQLRGQPSFHFAGVSLLWAGLQKLLYGGRHNQLTNKSSVGT